MKISISSEIDSLKSVILHRPGLEHYFVTPDHLIEWLLENNKLIHNPNYLLFDDLINPKKAIAEHKQLSDLLKHFIGDTNCFEITTLISDILKNQEHKKNILDECLILENKLYGLHNHLDRLQKLMKMNTEDIIFILLTGRDKNNNQDEYFRHPIPNLIFTRDIAAVIGETLVLTWGCRLVRRRENIIAKYIFNYHDLFRHINIYDFHASHPELSLEGGDIIVFDKNNICIGMSERTQKDTINALLPIIFKEGFERVYAIDLPKCRSAMHLDTIINRINTDEAIIFPPIFTEIDQNKRAVDIYTIESYQKLEDSTISNRSLLDLLEDDGIKINAIKCGGDKLHNQIREQWTEGVNFFTIKPGIIVGYDCNDYTIDSLQKCEYTHVASEDFLNNPSKYKSVPKLVITIPSSELSRGRGGTRCLTLPLLRS